MKRSQAVLIVVAVVGFGGCGAATIYSAADQPQSGSESSEWRGLLGGNTQEEDISPAPVPTISPIPTESVGILENNDSDDPNVKLFAETYHTYLPSEPSKSRKARVKATGTLAEEFTWYSNMTSTEQMVISQLVPGTVEVEIDPETNRGIATYVVDVSSYNIDGTNVTSINTFQEGNELLVLEDEGTILIAGISSQE